MAFRTRPIFRMVSTLIYAASVGNRHRFLEFLIHNDLTLIIVVNILSILLLIVQKNSVETTCLNLRFPRLSLWQVVPRRNERRFTNLFLRDNPISGHDLWKMRFKNIAANRYFICLYIPKYRNE